MLNDSTSSKLREMNLNVMAKTFNEQLSDPSFDNLGFEDRFGLIVDAEWNEKKSNRLTRLIKNAGYDIPGACMEDIEYHPDRMLDKTQLTRLSTCRYIEEHHNIIIMGATGNGKTYLSNALGIAANRNFLPVKYIRLPDMTNELAVAQDAGQYDKVVKQYKQVKLLIIDEWLLFPVDSIETRFILSVVNARHKRASTIFCSQFAPDGWHEKLGEPAVADAICDRIVHDSYKIVIHGEGMRKRKGLKEL